MTMQPEAAVAIVRSRHPKDSILLMRRAERAEDSWSGHWSFPGGRRDPQDRDPLDTALRELFEECGIRLNPSDLEAAWPHAVARRRTPPYLLVAPFLFSVDTECPVVLDPREAAEARWIPMSTLRDPSRHVLRPVPGRPAEMLFPCVDLDGPPLWGFTYRLITDWLELGPRHRPLEEAGFLAASDVLQFLLSLGLTVTSGWTGRTAAVSGAIPVAAVIDRFSGPGPLAAAVNCLDVHPDRIRILGPVFEEYFIVGQVSGA
jgi:8-oxo-dGTP diphosphatase